LTRFGAAVLCGGRSSRMGFDKAFLRLSDGRPLLADLAGQLAGRFGQVVLAAGAPDKFAEVEQLRPYRLIPDELPFGGPAAAAAAVLAACPGQAFFFMAGDMPVVDWPVIEQLAALMNQGADAALPRHQSRLEPLYAFYGPAAGPLLADSAAKGRGTFKEIFSRLKTAYLTLDGTALAAGLFANLNTPQDARLAGCSPPDSAPGLAAGPSPGRRKKAEALSAEASGRTPPPPPPPPKKTKAAAAARSAALLPAQPTDCPADVVAAAGPAPRELHAALRTIPKVDVIIQAAKLEPALARLNPDALLEAVRGVLAQRRQLILSGAPADPWPAEAWLNEIADEAARAALPSLRPVVNATGVVLHTNLGRSILAQEAAEAVRQTALSYSTLEYDPQEGHRRDRQRHVEELAIKLFGGETAMAVNNNAAAVLLASAALCAGRQAVISRGELVEIGDSFRLSDVLTAGGVHLREVGSTNSTKLADYQAAVKDGQVGMLVKVHASNFRMVGYCSQTEISELAVLAEAHNLPLVCDLGSGSLFDLGPLGLPGEPSARDALAQGASLATMSGDKLLGAAQAGLIVGQKQYIDLMKRHPLARALRIDKLSLAALEATLRLALRPEEALRKIPAMAMIFADEAQVKAKAEDLLARLGRLEGVRLELVEVEGQAGGGSGPERPLKSWAVAVEVIDGSTVELEKALRRRNRPVAARIHRGRLLLDARTIGIDELALTAEALKAAAAKLLKA
jgi:L-seryl-tRNA(Ser) seleniumtransferase